MKNKISPHAIKFKIMSIFLIAFLFQLNSYAQESVEYEVLSRGIGMVIAGDKAKAEDDAIASALRNAVEQTIGTLVKSDVLVQNYQTIEDNIYTETRGYVKRYQVIGKSQRSDNVVEVTVKAVVSKGDLKNDLEAIGVLREQKGNPRLMVLVDEKNMDEHYYSYSIDMNTSENVLMDVLIGKGFPFVDRDVAMQKMKKDMVLAALNGDETAAQSIAMQSGAEVLLIGKAFSKASSGGPAVLKQSGMISCQATINIRAVRADDGSVLATASEQGAAAHIDQLTGGTLALKRSAESAANELSDKIIDRYHKDVSAGTMVNLRLLNVASFSDLVKIKNMLPFYIRNVNKVYQRDYSQHTAQFEIDVKGSASKVAEEMALKDFSPYEIEIINVTQNTIVAKIVNSNLKEEQQ